MAQTTFAERLQRIEHQQGMPLKDRLLAGLTEEQEREASKSRAPGKPKRGGSKILRALAGFVLIYACMTALNSLNVIQNWLEASAAYAQHSDLAMIGIGVSLAALALFCLVKFFLAVARGVSQPWRLPFAVGMVAGLAMGLGPAEMTDAVIAQLN